MKYDSREFNSVEEIAEYKRQYYLGISMTHDYEYKIALEREESEQKIIAQNKVAFLIEYAALCEKYNIEVDAVCTHDGIELKYKKAGQKTMIENWAEGYK